MKKDIDTHKKQMTILFSISTLIVVLGNRFLTGTGYFISQVIGYILIIYSIYSGKIFSKKLGTLFIICYILILIAEIGSFVSTYLNWKFIKSKVY